MTTQRTTSRGNVLRSLGMEPTDIPLPDALIGDVSASKPAAVKVTEGAELAVAPRAPVPDRDGTIRLIRDSLRKRSGKTWSVTGGRGTSWGWITISAPPKRRNEYGHMSDADQIELGELLSIGRAGRSGECIAASEDYRAEYIARAEGRTPEVHGRPYWD